MSEYPRYYSMASVPKDYVGIVEITIDNGYAYVCNGKIHRNDGPAFFGNWYVEWWSYGQVHREDGPAVIFKSGGVYFYLNGKRLSKEEWFNSVPERQKERMIWDVDFWEESYGLDGSLYQNEF